MSPDTDKCDARISGGIEADVLEPLHKMGRRGTCIRRKTREGREGATQKGQHRGFPYPD